MAGRLTRLTRQKKPTGEPRPDGARRRNHRPACALAREGVSHEAGCLRPTRGGARRGHSFTRVSSVEDTRDPRLEAAALAAVLGARATASRLDLFPK